MPSHGRCAFIAAGPVDSHQHQSMLRCDLDCDNQHALLIWIMLHEVVTLPSEAAFLVTLCPSHMMLVMLMVMVMMLMLTMVLMLQKTRLIGPHGSCHVGCLTQASLKPFRSCTVPMTDHGS